MKKIYGKLENIHNILNVSLKRIIRGIYYFRKLYTI